MLLYDPKTNTTHHQRWNGSEWIPWTPEEPNQKPTELEACHEPELEIEEEPPPSTERTGPPTFDPEAYGISDLPFEPWKTRRNRRARATHAATLTIRSGWNDKLKKELFASTEPYPESIERPRTRGDCVDGPRPCPFVSCKHHLYLDVSGSGTIKLNFPDLLPEQLEESCSLDVADRGGMALHDVGTLMNVTRERVRQIEVSALRRIRESSLATENLEYEPGTERIDPEW